MQFFLFQFPKSEEEWKDVSKMYEDRWNFPHCLGAIDGKHIAIVPPANSGSFYYNYKGHHSLVLMAIVNAKYQFMYIDIGINGRISDGGVLQHTTFFQKLENSELQIPSSELVKGTNRNFPYIFVADDAFPLRPDMLKPFRQADLTSHERKIFNYRLSRARRTVENAFGILASRFRIFYTHINLEPENTEKVVKASCALHNFLIAHSKKSYAPLNCFYRENPENGSVISDGYNTENSAMKNLQRRNPGNTLNTSKIVRENFMNYFCCEGKLPWQDEYIS